MNSQNDWVQLNIVKNISPHFWVLLALYHFQPRDPGLLRSAYLYLSKLPPLHSPMKPPTTARLNSSYLLHAVSVLWLWSSFSGLLECPVSSDCPSLAFPSRPSSNLLLGKSFFKKAATCRVSVMQGKEYLVWSQTFWVHVHEIPEIKSFIPQGPQFPPFIKQELWSWFWWPPNLSE